MNKKFFEFIVVILVYRNADDLKECVESVYEKINSSRVVVVNAYYDDDSSKKIRDLAEKLNCDFIEVENKGYSYGNNRGIQYALERYDFNYIIISNPDIIVKEFPELNMTDADVIAPKTITLSGKNQNPMMIRENRLSEFLIYQGLKRNVKILFTAGIAVNKIQEKILRKDNKIIQNIFAAHGSFVIINKAVVEEINPLYDENFFLFAEEGVLAYRCREHNFQTVYNPNVLVIHKEDGSMKLADFSINNELKKANIYFYEKYVKKQNKRRKE